MSLIGTNHGGTRTIRIGGSVLAASVFVKSATLETEIPVIEVEGEQRYNGNSRCAEVLADECRDVQFVCFQMPAERRTRIGAREGTVFGVSMDMRLGHNTSADDWLIRVAMNILRYRRTVTRQIREQLEGRDFSRNFKSIVRKGILGAGLHTIHLKR